MKGSLGTHLGKMFFGMTLVLYVGYALPASGQAQPGNNDVYNSSGQQPSTAFIDAVGFGAGTDICDKIYKILSGPHYPPTGAVIDARGVTTNLTCIQGTPWYENSTGYINVPSTVLLPAATITIPSTWVLPNGTRVIGEGSIDPVTLNIAIVAPQTVIQACTANTCTSPLSGTMIQFGAPTPTCPAVGGCIGITLEDVTLNGSGLGVNGISNANAQELSYAKNVAMYQVLGTGLQISGNAQNSGPYSNITYDTGNSGVYGSTCASITNVSGGTRGIHKLTCISDNNSVTAIKLDSSNNSLEDIRIAGFNRGVVVGSQHAAKSNVLKNVWGDTITLRGVLSPPTVIEIASTSVTDLVLTGIANATSGTDTILDIATSTTLQDPAIAMYALGEAPPSPNNNMYSRFTTSPNTASWAVGSSAPPPSASCAKGSLFSCTGGISSNCTGSLYACIVSNGSTKWTLISKSQ